jgi:tRNA A-37 threonylcarbamoyl transferase component Bud32
MYEGGLAVTHQVQGERNVLAMTVHRHEFDPPVEIVADSWGGLVVDHQAMLPFLSMVNHNDSAERLTPPSDGDEAAALAWVRRRGAEPEGHLTARRLTGGVSSTVVAIHGRSRGVVVKRALETLQVEQQWHANPDRSLTEAAALRALAEITPHRVPRVIDADPFSRTLILEQAPLSASTWRERLLVGEVDPAVGRAVGTTVAAWHRDTWMPWDGAGAFSRGSTALEELRLGPFHETAATRFPDVSGEILARAQELRTSHLCLVHGDLSPKNILVGDDFLWILDPEVAHIGDPVFDIAFLGTHLLLAAIVRPDVAPAIATVWQSFVERYFCEGPSGDVLDRAPRHIGALLLARTDGLSPEPGLVGGAKAHARVIGKALLLSDTSDPFAMLHGRVV